MKISEGRNNIKNAILIDAVGQGFVSSLRNKPRGIWGVGVVVCTEEAYENNPWSGNICAELPCVTAEQGRSRAQLTPIQPRTDQFVAPTGGHGAQLKQHWDFFNQ